MTSLSPDPSLGEFRRGLPTSGVLSGLATTPVPGLCTLEGVTSGVVSSTGMVRSGTSSGVLSPKILPLLNLESTGLSSVLSVAPVRGTMPPISRGLLEIISDPSLFSGTSISGSTGNPSAAIVELILRITSSSPFLPGLVVRPNLSLSTTMTPRLGTCSLRGEVSRGTLMMLITFLGRRRELRAKLRFDQRE